MCLLTVQHRKRRDKKNNNTSSQSSSLEVCALEYEVVLSGTCKCVVSILIHIQVHT